LLCLRSLRARRIAAKTIVIQNIVNNQTVTADVGFKARKVLIDPHEYLISKKNQPIHTSFTKEQFLEPVTISPNPFTNYLNVMLQQQNGKEILFRLYDNLGRVVVNKTRMTNGSMQTFSLDVPSNLLAGNYLLVVSADGKSIAIIL
jgi:hypothetical protein